MIDKKLEVLFGNDERGIRESVKMMIEEYGLAVDLAQTPQEIIEKARKNKYLAIITDLNYDGTYSEEGYGVIKKIREIDKTTPIYLSTLMEEKRVIENGKEYGATEVLTGFGRTEKLIKLLENLKTK